MTSYTRNIKLRRRSKHSISECVLQDSPKVNSTEFLNFSDFSAKYLLLYQEYLRGYTSVNAENLGDFREFFGRKVLN